MIRIKWQRIKMAKLIMF